MEDTISVSAKKLGITLDAGKSYIYNEVDWTSSDGTDECIVICHPLWKLSEVKKQIISSINNSDSTIKIYDTYRLLRSQFVDLNKCCCSDEPDAVRDDMSSTENHDVELSSTSSEILLDDEEEIILS